MKIWSVLIFISFLAILGIFIIIPDGHDLLSFMVALIALIISLAALVYTVETYMLKSGIYVRGMYGITLFNQGSNQAFIKRIALENMKDKAIIIFQVSMKIGDNYFLLIDDFKDDPLIIKPFEIFQKEYQMVSSYTSKLTILDFEELIADPKIKKKFVLYTNNGRYEVNETIDFRHSFQELDLDACITLVQAQRIMYKDKILGDRVRYILEIDENEPIFLYHNDDHLQVFNHVYLNKSAMSSEGNLKAFFDKHKELGHINYDSIQIVDVTSQFNKLKRFYPIEKKATKTKSVSELILCKYLTVFNKFVSQITRIRTIFR